MCVCMDYYLFFRHRVREHILYVYCYFICVSLHGQDKVRPDCLTKGGGGGAPTTVPSLFLLINCVTFSYLFHLFTLGLNIVLGLVFYKGKLY